ncbi:hypothetical protein BJV82DRAFT_664884 [Fennellomyces sp. T-0311]|nr:hypothetical protein BJV82DRAFT_664884 [Fennellomyces sp. T-0311]
MDHFEIVYATHDFVAENEDEIPLKKGEAVYVIEKDEDFQDGWWRGRNAHGEIGLFPMNYISLAAPKPSSLEQKFGTLEDTLSAMQINSPTSSPPSLDPNSNLATPSSSKSRSSTESGSTNTSSRAGSGRRNVHQMVAASLGSPALRDTSPDEWTIDQVASWLDALGFKDAIDTFREQEITGDILLELTQQSLKELGIGTFGKRFKIHNAIQALRQEMLRPIETTQNEPANRYMATSNGTVDGSSHGSRPSMDGNRSANSGSSNVLHHSELERRALSSVSTSMRDLHRGDFNRAPSISAPLNSHHQRAPSIPRSTTEYAYRQPGFGPASPPMSPTYHFPQSPGRSTDELSSFATSQTSSTNTGKTGRILSLAREPVDDVVAKRNERAGNQGKPDMEGWLHKQSDKYRTWNKRWFVLKGPNLFYFKSPKTKDLRVKGIVNLAGYTIITDETINPGKYCFKMQHEEERTFYFYTTSEKILRSWMRALMKATISRNYSEPVLSSSSIPTVSLEMARRMQPRPPSVIMESKESGGGLTRTLSESSRPFSLTRTMQSPPPPPAIRQSRSENTVSSPRPPMQPLSRHVHPLSNGSDESGFLSRSTTGSSDTFGRSRLPQEQIPTHTHLSTVYDVPDEDDEDLIDPQQGDISKYAEKSAENLVDPDVQWVNEHIYPSAIQNLEELRLGEPLITLLESLSGKTVRRQNNDKSKTPSMVILDAIVAGFRFMGREGIRVDGTFTIKDVFSGDKDKIRIMLKVIKEWADAKESVHQKQD